MSQCCACGRALDSGALQRRRSPAALPHTPLPSRCVATLQADTTLPPEQRRNYKNAFDALGRIVKDEGVKGLFTGAGPTVVRACALNMGMIASNDQVCGPACLRRSAASAVHSLLAAWRC